MKLFELFESPLLGGAQNLKAIANAVASSSSAQIDLAGEPVTLEYPEARYVYGLYKQALKDGRQEVFMQMLSDPQSFDKIMKPMQNMLYRDRGPEMAQAAAARIGQPGMQEAAPLATPDQPAAENTNTLKYIVKRFPMEVKDFMSGGDLDAHEHLYDALFDYYMMHGEMPYGIAKARTGDPVQWISDRFQQDAQPYLHLHESLTEGKKQVAERWDDDDDDWWGLKDKTRKTSSGGTVTQTGTGVVHKGKYGSEYQGDDGDEDDYDEWGNLKPAAKKAKAAAKAAKAAEPKRSRGRPSAAIKSSDGGETISDYSTWYRKSKRSHPERKIVGSANKAVAVIPKGKKFAVVATWDGSKGNIHAKAGELMSADQLSGYKSAKGRPKKVREFIENLRYVVEAKNHMGETEYNTYSGWKAACRKAGADEFEGDRDICQAKKDGKGVGEWDGAVGTVYDDAHKKAKK